MGHNQRNKSFVKVLNRLLLVATLGVYSAESMLKLQTSHEDSHVAQHTLTDHSQFMNKINSKAKKRVPLSQCVQFMLAIQIALLLTALAHWGL